jgi:3-oxoacyl-(acyl-carrier-protein) synthase/3-hydroxymyristoyl/3-hydroxydecanoyl-(acyl carrier protein) dehydratase/1-acyl-sn-glycerol-3-phosphate acyltransferase
VTLGLWRDGAVAVVGWGCVLPGALTPEELWRLVLDRRDVLSAVPPGRWAVDARHVMALGTEDAVDRSWSDRGGYVSGFEEVFEPQGFRLPAEEVGRLEPGTAWLLHAGREALRSAGCDVGRAFPRAGAIVGNLSYPTPALARYAASVWWPEAAPGRASDPRQRFMSGRPAHLLAAALGLSAGGHALDAACASSLYAIDQACAWLLTGRADLMLAGGVNHADDLFLHIGFCALKALSPSGRSRPFHREADGLVPAEGAALVALKRLDDAVAAGDPILGVIRAVGLSNDGRGGGLLAPNQDGQERAVRAAYAAAGLAPRDVAYVECHATGTPVGDAVELRTLARVFGGASGLAVGSLKGNLGHLITASGAASLVKTLAALGARVLPPAPHADDVQPALAEAGLRVPVEAEPWPAGPRRAAISNFGFGGNNAHLIVEAWEPPARPRAPRAARAEAVADSIAVVGMSVRVGTAADAGTLAAVLLEGAPHLRPARDGGLEARAETVALDLARVRFPPHDLERTLAQQLFMLAAGLELEDAIVRLDGARTAVIVGMQCDAEIARPGLRWRLPQWAGPAAADPAWLAAARDAVIEPLGAARVLGAMPNVVANRLSAQFDIRGPSYAVSAEEASGTVALDLAASGLRRGEIDAALVGAVDLSCEPVQAGAARLVLPPERHAPADAAVLLVLKRLGDARAAGDRVLALIPARAPAEAGLCLGIGDPDAIELSAVLGHAHAASGLLHVAAAVIALGHRRRPAGPGHAGVYDPSLDTVRVRVHPYAGPVSETWIEAGDEGARPLPPAAQTKTTRHFPAHLPPVDLPRPKEPVDEAVGPQRMPRAPSEMPAFGADVEVRAAPSVAADAPFPSRVAVIHQDHLRLRAAAQEQFVQTSRAAIAALATAPGGVAAPSAGPTPGAPEPAPPLVWNRDQLRVHAGGRVSAVFGPAFASQDAYAVQVRMPEEPLLLADRVTRIEGPPGVLGRGTVVTETDVREGAFHVHEGRMLPGFVVEAGQADLLLISWMGIDAHNRGERRYRLLGCDLSFHGALPAPGETLRYEITIDSHAQQGGVRLFFFHYDCTVNGELRLRVRNGRAGFFTERELQESRGVIWDPQTAVPLPGARNDPPRVGCARRSLDARALSAFAAGDTFGAFGAGFEAARAHVRSPRIPGGDLLLLDEVTDLDPAGGPWRRGYARARLAIRPDHWFFAGHFKNDPCMPGTLMFEGALQAMSLYLGALGFTLDRDGWRFEPVLEEAFALRCQGQVVPTSRELVCEIFVEEMHAGPWPTLYADLLGTVDGRKAFHCRRMGLRLVPDFPLGDRAVTRLRQSAPPGAVARAEDVTFGYDSLLACAWGRPSHAFGALYRPFDSGRRIPRLPGPPYHFMTRVTHVDGPLGGQRPSSATVEYDVPKDAWYFADAGGSMPFAVLLEAALQPCGWLASYAGCALGTDEDLSFRNLDGSGTVHREVLPETGTLRTHARLRSISRAGSMVLVAFDVKVWAADALVYELETRFGFFPAAALAGQAGMGDDPELRAWALEAVRPQPDAVTGLALSRGRLAAFDEVAAWWPVGGAAGLGRAVAERAVDAGHWPFRAHFFQDPVQPGSLGLHAILELVRWTMNARGTGAAGARFEPIALGRPHAWKFRGQVVPAHQRVTVAVELRETGRDASGDYAVADGHLFADGLRIYQAEGFAVRVVGAAPPAAARPVPREPAGIDLCALRDFWCAEVGAPRGWLGDDLFAALLRRYVRALHAAGPPPRRALYLANHQTQIESWLATIVLTHRHGAPVVAVANAKHRARWVGWLRDALFSRPGARLPQNIVYFEKGRPESLPALLRGLAEDVRTRGSSLLVHAEGTRQRGARQPMRQVTSLLIDLALDLDLPIVPLRFRGGLPALPLPEKLEFPLGHTAQDYVLGPALAAEELRVLPYADRRTRVLAAIDALEPDLARAGPHPPDPDFARRVVERQVLTGAGEVEATLFCALAEAREPGEEARLLLAAEHELRLPANDWGRWLAAIARRLFGPRGPRVVVDE